MKNKKFFLILISFLFLLIFFKTFLSNFILIYPGDLFLALCLSILNFRSTGILLYFCLGLLGLLESLDFFKIEIFWCFYFILIGFIWNYLKNYIASETLEAKLSLWSLGILSTLIIRIIIYFLNLNTFINWKIFLNLLVKSFYYIISTFLWILILNKIFIVLFPRTNEEYKL